MLFSRRPHQWQTALISNRLKPNPSAFRGRSNADRSTADLWGGDIALIFLFVSLDFIAILTVKNSSTVPFEPPAHVFPSTVKTDSDGCIFGPVTHLALFPAHIRPGIARYFLYFTAPLTQQFSLTFSSSF